MQAHTQHTWTPFFIAVFGFGCLNNCCSMEPVEDKDRWGSVGLQYVMFDKHETKPDCEKLGSDYELQRLKH